MYWGGTADDAHYQGVKEKEKAMREEYPNRPNADRQAPEAETPGGQAGAFADHRGQGTARRGEDANGAEEAAATRSGSRLGQMAKHAAKSVMGTKSFSTAAASAAPPLKPTHDKRDSPAAADKGSLQHHPGYTAPDTPIGSTHPRDIPPAHPNAIPSSSVQNASTHAAQPPPGIHTMAAGANQPGAGADATHPQQRSQKVWAANARPADFNPVEGKRHPLRDGGSNQGGFDSHGKSRT
jgi:hypothetical protein